MHKKIMIRRIVFFVLLGCGFFYRLYLGSFAYPGLIWDMSGYHEAAVTILSGDLVRECCLRNVGYSMFLAGVYGIVGSHSLLSVSIIQAMLDCITAMMVYALGKYIGNSSSAWISFVLYLFNPFSSSYTGLRLTEILTIFLLTLGAYICIQKQFMISRKRWVLFGWIMGILVFVKLSFVWFSFFIVGTLALFIFRKWKKVIFTFFVCIGFLIASSYSLMSNLYYFDQFRITPPFSHPWIQLYGSFYIGHYPELSVQREEYGSPGYEYVQAMYDFAEAPDEEKIAVDHMYKQKFIEKIQTEWFLFITYWVRNVFWIWDYDHLYYYEDPFYPRYRWLFRICICILGMSSFVGVWNYCCDKGVKNVLRNTMFLFSSCLFLYISLFFSLVNNESRYSLYFFPFLSIWAGYGVYVMIDRLTSYRA